MLHAYLPDEIDNTACPLSLPGCIISGQNMQVNYRNTTHVDCKVKFSKMNEAQMHAMQLGIF